MSTGTITEAKRAPDDDWSNDNGKFEAWATVIEADGKTYRQNINRKVAKDGTTLGDPTGAPVELVNGKWKIVSQQGGGNRSGGAPKDFKADPAKLRAENARSALHAAKDLVVGGKVELAEMGKFTGTFYDYIEKHAKVGE